MSMSLNPHKEHSLMLFDISLGSAKNQSELEELLRTYVPPTYDPLYVCLATRDDFNKERQWIEDMWMEFQQFADPNFPAEFKAHFSQRAWELYLGITLHKRWGLCTGSKSKHEYAGPDFKTIHKTNRGSQTIWIEATAAEKGDPPNGVPEMVINDVADLPEDRILLRLTSRLYDKYLKYCKDVKQGRVGTSDPYIIAINRSQLEHLDPQIPLILKCLFRLGWQILSREQKRSDLKTTESLWITRDHITKGADESGIYLPFEGPLSSKLKSEPVNSVNSRPISLGFFDDLEHSGISAIIYAETDIINSPILSEEMGNNFTIVLNPHAKNPLPGELLTFGKVWRKEGDQIFLLTSK
jgi:hypothetical protein